MILRVGIEQCGRSNNLLVRGPISYDAAAQWNTRSRQNIPFSERTKVIKLYEDLQAFPAMTSHCATFSTNFVFRERLGDVGKAQTDDSTSLWSTTRNPVHKE